MPGARRSAWFVLFICLIAPWAAVAQRTWVPAVPLGGVLEAEGPRQGSYSYALDAEAARPAAEAAAAARPAPGGQAAGDENWDDLFGFPGAGWQVYAAAVAPNGDLYVGGWFTEAGGIPANRIARWDGRRWHALGGGLDGTVYAVAVAADGTVYAGGDFTKAGEFNVRGVAKWDGTAWSPLGLGLEGSYGGRGTAKTIAVRGAEVYVGGSFEKAGDAAAINLAKWDGTAWSDVGGGVGRFSWDGKFEPGGTVNTIVVSGTDVYVGGYFDATPAGRANSIARWDGTAWSALGTGVEGSYEGALGTVNAVAVENGTVYAGGQFDRAGGAAAKNLAKWDGAAWGGVGGGVRDAYGGGGVYALHAAGGALYVGGTFASAGPLTANNFARWDGANWSALQGGVTAQVSAIVPAPDGGVYVTGSFETAGQNHRMNYVARWSGDRWHALGQGVQYNSINGTLYDVAVGPGGEVYVGGWFTHVGGVPATNVAVWDGSAWSALGEGTDNTVRSLVVVGGDLYVGGEFTKAGGQSASHVARWNIGGKSWSAVGSGTNGTVHAMTTDGARLFVGGSFSAAGATDADDVAIWDGAAWSKAGAGATISGTVYALALDGAALFVGGDFSQIRLAGETEYVTGVNALAMWDSAEDAWYTLGDGLLQQGTYSDYAGRVYALALTPEGLYVGGDFTKAGTVAANGIAMLDAGAGWQPVGSSIGGGDQEVRALAAHGSVIYAGGGFEAAGGQTVGHIARWDGQAWTPLGSGLALGDYDDGVEALQLHGDNLWVAGDFASAGGNPSAGLARWTLEEGGQNPVTEARIAVTPQTLTFAEVAVGQFAEQTFTVSNQAAATAALAGTVGVPTGPFTIVQGGGAFSLAPGASRTVTVRFTPAAAGAAAGTIEVTHNGANVAGPVTVALAGQGRTADPVVVVRNFDPNGPQRVLYAEHVTPLDTGFVFGTNVYGDRAKSVRLVVPAGKTAAEAQVTGVKVWFGYRRSATPLQSYTIRVYDAEADGRPAGQPLYSQSYPVSGILADEDPQTPAEPTVHAFSQPVRVGPSFVVAVDFGSYPAPGDLALVASDPLGHRVSDVWEQWSDGTWANVSDAWTGSAPGSGTNGWQIWIEAEVATSSAVANGPERELPEALALHQNYPNPFNPETRIAFDLPAAGHVTLVVFDVTGREVATLVDGFRPAGAHEVSFDARALPSGAYFYRLRAGETLRTRQMLLVK